MGIVDEVMQVCALGRTELQRRGQRIEHVRGGPDVAALFEEGVVGGGDRGQGGDLLTTQAARPPPGTCGQSDIAGLQPFAAGAQEIGEFAAAGGPLGRGLIGSGHPDTSNTSKNGRWIPL